VVCLRGTGVRIQVHAEVLVAEPVAECASEASATTPVGQVEHGAV